MTLNPSLPPTPPSRYSWATLLAIQLAAILAGCTTTPPTQPEFTVVNRVIAQNEDFVVLHTRRDDELAQLAQHYYGDAEKAGIIAEFNQIASLQPGSIVVVPLKLQNPLGITPKGFQTVPILCYHRTGAGKGKLVVSATAFDEQMGFLARNGYHVVSLNRLKGFLSGKEGLPAKSIVITFDDGYRSTFEIAYPVLKKYGFPATLFLYSDFVGATDALTWAQMKEMADSGLIEVQPHSKTHANLSAKLPRESSQQYRERLRQEIEVPARTIESRLGIQASTFALPYGDTNDTVVGVLKQNGIDLALTVTPGGNAFFAYPFMLRRTMVFGDDSLTQFAAKLAVFTPNRGP